MGSFNPGAAISPVDGTTDTLRNRTARIGPNFAVDVRIPSERPWQSDHRLRSMDACPDAIEEP
jgi:hypothetical protein